jgi:hypothetical protein
MDVASDVRGEIDDVVEATGRFRVYLGAWVGIRQWGKADPRRRPDMCQGC